MTDSEALTEARVPYARIIEIVNDCVERMTKAGESHAMLAKWISEGINAASALGTAPAEPVAWRIDHPDYAGVYPPRFTTSMPHEDQLDGMLIMPLYASPAPANAAEIRAKALEEAARYVEGFALEGNVGAAKSIIAKKMAAGLRALSEATANGK